MHLSTALALGLLGGLHCAGMCGPLMLALPGASAGGWRFVAGRLIYQAGRIATYCALGVALGLVGQSFALAGLQQGVSVGLGVALLAAVLLAPRALDLPWLAGAIQRLRALMSVRLRRRSLGSLAVLGALNGLLPCGLVYVAGAGAVAAGGWLAGIEYMAVFGLGTLPTMLAISLSGRLIPTTARLRLVRLVPASVALVAGLLILRGLGLGIPYLSPALGSASSPAGATCCPMPPETAGVPAPSGVSEGN